MTSNRITEVNLNPEQYARACELKAFVTDDEYATAAEIIFLRDRLTKMTKWLEANQPDVFKRGLWDALQ